MKKITILGSTGSIGTNALKVIGRYPDRFSVEGLTAGQNISLLARQIEQFRPRVVAVSDREASIRLRGAIVGAHVPEILSGIDGISAVAAEGNADIVLSSIVGSAGLLPTLSAIRSGRVVALANKETLVMAGSLIMKEAARCNSTILPVDSEHSALFQCMLGGSGKSVSRLILTASGGPFLGRPLQTLGDVTPKEALNHPKWRMGEKVTIDSATLMNKGLEVMEAHHLFGMPPDRIDVLIHPQSIVHSIVQFLDGSYMAQLSRPDMKGPIAFALSYPERLEDIVEPLDWTAFSEFTFLTPDLDSFPCLSLARHALKTGGTLPAVLNASNEIAVNAFLRGSLGFTKIPVIIERVMQIHSVQPADDLSVILESDRWAREQTHREIAAI